MIVGGNGVGTEVFQFIVSNSIPLYGELPEERYDAVGTIFGDSPVLCGGKTQGEGNGDYHDNCITFVNSTWDKSHLLTENRVYSAGVQINYTTFWILGGGASSYYLSNTTEFIVQGKPNGIPGPTLPYNMSNMCVAKLSENKIFVIGGWNVEDGESDDVWIYNPQKDFERKPGPSLNQNRYQHICSILRDGEKTQIIVAGGYGKMGTNEDALKSVEIYDPIENKWHSGNCF